MDASFEHLTRGCTRVEEYTHDRIERRVRVHTLHDSLSLLCAQSTVLRRVIKFDIYVRTNLSQVYSYSQVKFSEYITLLFDVQVQCIRFVVA